MTNTDLGNLELSPEAQKIKDAIDIVENGKPATPEERKEAEKIVQKEKEAWDETFDDLDAILDIEDDDEREEAWQAFDRKYA